MELITLNPTNLTPVFNHGKTVVVTEVNSTNNWKDTFIKHFNKSNLITKLVIQNPQGRLTIRQVNLDVYHVIINHNGNISETLVLVKE